MSYFDEARALSEIIRMRGMKQGELARNMGVSQSFIANKLRLLNHSKKIQDEICKRGLSERHARALLRLKDEKEVLLAIEKIVTRNLNVRESEVMIDSLVPAREVRQDYAVLSEGDIRAELEKNISSALAALRRLGKRASRTVSYYGNKSYITICID